MVELDDIVTSKLTGGKSVVPVAILCDYSVFAIDTMFIRAVQWCFADLFR